MIHKELLLEIISDWTPDQINNYIMKLEGRVLMMNLAIKELREVKRKKTKKSTPDNGGRSGN